MPSLVPREIEDNTYLKVESVREGTGGGGGGGGVGGEQIRCIVAMYNWRISLHSFYRRLLSCVHHLSCSCLNFSYNRIMWKKKRNSYHNHSWQHRIFKVGVLSGVFYDLRLHHFPGAFELDTWWCHACKLELFHVPHTPAQDLRAIYDFKQTD